MQKHVVILIALGVYLSLSACKNNSNLNSSSQEEINISETNIASNESTFDIFMDQTLVQDKRADKTTVWIYTELTDWSFTVQTENGKTSNKTFNSFDYHRPKNGEREDIITINLLDNENNKRHVCVIPLHFISSPESESAKLFNL